MITRYNYEEFFLLYVDNELSAVERQLVESFAAENPDLRAELNILMQCLVEPEGDSYSDKASLLKPVITEESLLLYVDGELNEDARLPIERRAQEDPVVQQALALLRQTISEPEPEIVFRQKELLYKKEGSRKIAFLPPFRYAAAAVLLLLVGLALLYVTRRKEGAPVTLIPVPAKKTNSTVTRIPDPALYSSKNGRQGAIERQDANGRQGANGRQDGIGAQDARASRDMAGRPDHREKGRESKHKVLARNVPPPNRTIVTKPVSEGAEETTRKSNSAIEIARIDERMADRPPTSGTGPVQGGTFATEALLRERTASLLPVDATGEDENAETAPAKKGRLRGVLRRVSRVFEKTSSRNDDDRRGILIGNLQIALK